MTLLAAAILYGIVLAILLSVFVIVGTRTGNRRRPCIYNKSDCACQTTDAVYFVHAAEQAWPQIPGLTDSVKELARAANAKRPPDKVAGDR